MILKNLRVPIDGVFIPNLWVLNWVGGADLFGSPQSAPLPQGIL